MTVRNAKTASAAFWARVISFLVGVWLFISEIAWRHSGPARTNTWVLGLIIAIFSLLATSQPRARLVNTLAAIWLFFSSLAIFHYSAGTVWNNVIAAIVVFVLSLVGGTAVASGPPRTLQRPVGA